MLKIPIILRVGNNGKQLKAARGEGLDVAEIKSIKVLEKEYEGAYGIIFDYGDAQYRAAFSRYESPQNLAIVLRKFADMLERG